MRRVAKIGLAVCMLPVLAIPALPLINRALVPSRTAAALHEEDVQQRVSTIAALQADYPQESQQALRRLIEDPDVTTRSRAAAYLVNSAAAPTVANALLRHLLTDPVGEVRLCCAVGLLPLTTPDAQQAFIQVLQDQNDKVVQVAVVALRRRGGAAVVKPLFGLLHHPSWDVRLAACKALIALNVADSRVIATLETLSHEPEAAAYDAKMEVAERREHEQGHVPEFTWGWGKINTVLKQAKMIAATNPRHKRQQPSRLPLPTPSPVTPTDTPLPSANGGH